MAKGKSKSKTNSLLKKKGMKEYLKKIEVFNMLGSLVEVYGNEKQIDLSKLNIGLYLIRFTSENGVEQIRVEVSR